jgi:hypothetical protein
MGPKQDPRDNSQLEQRDECNCEQRMVERCDHGEQGVGCEQGANYEGCDQMVSEPEPDCGAISWQKILPKIDAEIFSAKRCHGLIDLIQIVTGDEIRNTGGLGIPTSSSP